MEACSCVLIVLFTTILLIYIIGSIKARLAIFQTFQNLGIPGPTPNFIFGNLLSTRLHFNLNPLRRTPRSNVLQVMSAWEKEFGKIYGYFSGLRPILVVSDLETTKEILIRNSSNFINRPRIMVTPRPLAHTLVGLRGQRWKDVRSILTPTFSASKMRQMTPLMNSSVTVTLSLLEKLRDQRDFDVLALYQGLTCDVISKCALAMKVNCQLDPKDKFLKAVKGFLAHAMSPFIVASLCFPIVGWVMGKVIDSFAISGQMTEMICENVERVMRTRRREEARNRRSSEDHNQGLRNGEAQSESNDLSGSGSGHVPTHTDVLQLMMDTTECEVQGKRLSDEEIVANAWVFVLGGFETTACALSYTTYLLMRHPEVQERLYHELQGTFEMDEIPTYEQVNGLTYLDQVICESLRLFPPVVTFVVRDVEETIVLRPYTLNPPITIQIPVWQIHHDPNLWPNPYKFDPERFSQGNKKSHHSMSWIPFGAGPRSCVGIRFALLETKFALARIFRIFKFLPSELTEEELELTVPTVTITPKNGIHLRCERRAN